MTVLVGILSRDGVVLGADSSATFGPRQGHPTIEQAVQKVFVVQNRFILAGTGQVGAGQRFTAAVDTAWTGKRFSGLSTPTDFAKTLCKVGIEDFASTEMKQGSFGGLVAFPIKNQHHLCEFAVQDFQPELKTPTMWFSSMGSGQPITDPFLGLMRRVFFPRSQPTVREGLFLTAWALMHAIDLNPGGINGPPQIATLTFKGNEPEARLLSDDELEEHKNNVQGAEAHLAHYCKILNGEISSGVQIPAIPPAATEEDSKHS